MKHIILLFAVFFLSSCISLKSETPPPTLFLLNAQNAGEDKKPMLDYAVIVDKPKIKSGLNTDRIALISNQGRVLDYFAEARWNGRLENVVQDFMIETLENSFEIVAVSDTAIDQKADFKLITHIHDFQAEYPDGNVNTIPNLHISFSVAVLRLRDNKIVSDIKIQETQPAASNTLTDITYGLERLMQEGFIQVHNGLSKVR